MVLCALFALGIPEARAQDPVYAEIGLNKDVFYLGDYMYIYLNVGNNGLDVMIDAYMSITEPDGAELFAPAYSPLAMPYEAGFHLPGGWASGWVLLDYLQLPSIALPMVKQGEYTISFWLCATGTSDMITPKSTQTFRMVPCEIDSWVSRDYVLDVEAGESGIWVGLRSGLRYIPYDGSRRIVWHREDGPMTSWTGVFKGPNSTAIAAGLFSHGLYIYDSCGWRSMLDTPDEAGCFSDVYDVVTDAENRIWIRGPSLGCLKPDGEYVDYTSEFEYASAICLTPDGHVCVASEQKIYIFEDDAFRCIDLTGEYPNPPSIIHCDDRWNVWMTRMLGMGESLIRHNLLTGETTQIDMLAAGFPKCPTGDIKSDSLGNVWFSASDRFVIFDGDGFSSIDGGPYYISHFTIGDDDTKYIATHEGVVRYRDGDWHLFEKETPIFRESFYDYLVGLPGGEAILTGSKVRYSDQEMLYGYERLNGDSWIEVETDELSFHVSGLYQGKTGQWAWGWDSDFNMTVYFGVYGEWTDKSNGLNDIRIMNGILEADDGQVYLSHFDGLMNLQGDRWVTVDAPAIGSCWYTSLMIDHTGKLYLHEKGSNEGLGIHVRDEDGNWTRIDCTNLLPANPACYGLSGSDILYVGGATGRGETTRCYVTVISDGNADTFWFDDLGFAVAQYGFFAFDLADRAWLSVIDSNGLPRMIIHDPSTGLFHDLFDPTYRLIPQYSNSNRALVNNMFDRSFSKYGTLWYTGFGPTRLNLAPQSRMLVDREVYVAGDLAPLKVHFTNYAGSIAVDWYAGLQFWDTSHIFYWVPNFETGESEWVEEETPAFRNITVPTDTSFIYDFGEVIIPEYAYDGHYKWRSGFKRAGEDEWLGVGFPSYNEFCVVVPLGE